MAISLLATLESGGECATRAPISLTRLVGPSHGLLTTACNLRARRDRGPPDSEWWALGLGRSNWRIGPVGYEWPPSVQTFATINLVTGPHQGELASQLLPNYVTEYLFSSM
jgi:hypothetical protein